jgi:hypothetical protein
MKKSKRDLVRVQGVIDSGRGGVSNDFNNVLIKDLDKILRDYFDYKEFPELKICKNGSKFCVEITLIALNLKTFGFIAKQ